MEQNALGEVCGGDNFAVVWTDDDYRSVSQLMLLIAGSLCLFHTTTALEGMNKTWNMATRPNLGTATVSYGPSRQPENVA